MSYIWTKEDLDKVESAKTGRTRSHPTDWQSLFHSDWELASQGDSPWLSRAAKEPASESSETLWHLQGLRAHLAGCTSCVVPTDTGIVKQFQFNITPHRIRRSSWRGPHPNEWAPSFAYNRRERRRGPQISPALWEAIQSSRGILQLHDDWDTEGSPGYSEATWNRAITFLLLNAVRHRIHHQGWLTAPRILPGPDGNIDLHWKTPQRELLISIPSDPTEPAAYYGDDKDDGTDNAIRGRSLDTSMYNEWIFAWLMR
jgi:hypothetical protein